MQRVGIDGLQVHAGPICLHADTARFRADDPDELVLASLACPICLRGAGVEWELESTDGYDPSVECVCPDCDERWRVYVTPYQALRLGLMVVHAA